MYFCNTFVTDIIVVEFVKIREKLVKAPPDWHFFMSLCRYAPCVRQNPRNVWAEYAQNTSGWHNDIKKPFHNGLKLDIRILASLVLTFPDTRESQSEGGKNCRATLTLPKRPPFFGKLA